MYPMNLCEIMRDLVMLVVVSVMYPLNLHVIMRDLVMLVDSVMYPLNLHVIMRDLVMLVVVSVMLVVFVVSFMFL